MNRKVVPVLIASLVGPLALASSALAQQAGSAPAPATGGGSSAPSAPPGAVNAYGLPVMSGSGSSSSSDMNSHLPASARPSTDLNNDRDTFDLNNGSTAPAVVHGGQGAAAVLGQATPTTPSVHVVKRGDTLAEIAERYYNTLYAWPKVWSYNPEVQNPNWIYPGDQIRLRPPQAIATDAQPTGSVALGSGVAIRRPTVPPQTVFLRDQGWIDDPAKDTWGELAASFDDHMFLTPGDDVYVQIEGDREVKVGQELSIFRPLRPVSAGDVQGEIVSIIGLVRVEKWDADNKVVRAAIVEAYDTIERGAKVGAIGRRFDVVPIVRNQNEVSASVLTSFYPNVLFGTNQVVFIDKGSADGLASGNRLFVVRRGDNYRATLTNASRFATYDVRYEQNKATIVGGYTGSGLAADAYPEEVVGEVRVLRTREHSATCLVTNATGEIELGDKLVARKGY